MLERRSQAHIIGFPTDAAHDLLKGYIYACEAEGKRPSTIRGYREGVERYLTLAPALGLPVAPHAVSKDHVRRYLAHLRGAGNAQATVADRLVSIRLWFRWLVREGLLDADPTEGVSAGKPERKVLKAITPAQVRDLLRLCEADARGNGEDRALAYRNRAVVLVLYNTGLRASELCGADLGDVDIDAMTLTVREGKGGKERQVWLGKVGRDALWRYVAQHRGRSGGPLLLSRTRRRLRRESLTQLLTGLGRRAGWRDPECHPHMFRRGFAVEFLRAGGDPFRLQMLLGHEKLDMTRLYVQALGASDALEAGAKFGPADRL